MQIVGRKRCVTLMSWVVIFANPLPILAFAGSEHALLTKTLAPRQIEAQPTSASSLFLEPSSVAFPVPSTLGSSRIEQTEGVRVADDTPNDDAPKDKDNDEPRRRALPAPLKDFLSLRPVDYIVDFKGERSGFATNMASWTGGVTHRFNELVSVRPEVRYEHAFSARPWDNGLRKDQFMFAIDALLRF